MPLSYVDSKDELPSNIDTDCPICFEPINVNEDVNGMPNCVICSECGHRFHRICYDKTKTNICPICREVNTMRNCKSNLGYSYVERKGGKRRTSKRKKTNKRRKTNKRKKTRTTRNKF